MKFLQRVGAVAFAAVVGMVPVSASATTVIDFTADNSTFTWFGNSQGCNAGCTLGYKFNVAGSVAIDGLGVFDAGSDGLNNSHQVGIWNSAGTLLASTTVGPGSANSEASASGAGSYVFGSIANLVLGAGDYVVGAMYAVGTTDAVVFNAGGIFSNVAGVSYTELRFVNSGVFGLPGGTSTLNDRYFGPTMRVSAVPVPATLPLLLGGIGIIGMIRRKQRAN